MIGPDRESHPARVLIVDDDLVTRRLLREAVRQAGFQAIEAASGMAAVAYCRLCRPDVVLLDIVMPGLDGFATCEAIRALPDLAHVPVVMITGLDDTASINRAFEIGATTFITKPVNLILLVHRLRYIVRGQAIADRLRDSEARIARAQRLAKLGYWEWDSLTRRVRCSDGVRDIFGFDEAQSPQAWPDFLRFVDPADRDRVAHARDEAIRQHTGHGIEYRIRRDDGTARFVREETEISISAGCGGSGVRILSTFQDISDRRLAEEQVRTLACFDSVTGLPNRAYLREILGHALGNSRRREGLSAVIHLDLDHFKRINDSFGHGAGDGILREVASRLTECVRRGDPMPQDKLDALDLSGPTVRSEDTVAHLGGDAFVILLTEIRRPEDAAKAAQRLARALKKPFLVEGTEVELTASMGLSVFPVDGEDESGLLKNAEAAMYHAKDRGRDRYQFFMAALNVRAVQRFALETALRRALDRNEMSVHYQPQIDLIRRRVIGVEALLRWYHPQIGPIPPDQFIPIAEETGLIVPIGEWVVEEACRQAAVWEAEDLPPLRIAVNVSAVQFRQRRFAQRMEGLLAQAPRNGTSFEFELTESVLLDNTQDSIAILNALAELGASVAIDDFGIGYSSLSYLRRIPLSAVKIDRSFIRDVTSDEDDAAIVSALIALAHTLRLRVVGEGAEDPQQLAFLIARNCDEVQGYFFSPPMEGATVTKWMRQWRWLAPVRSLSRSA
jgi:predicted signal transduction protein with EAL and GGDEF domain